MLSHELCEVLGDLQSIASYFSQCGRTPAERQKLSHAIYDVEYKLMELHQDHLSGLSSLSNSIVNLSDVFQLAAQVYILLVLRQVHRRSSIVQKYIHILSAEIQTNQSSIIDARETENWNWSILMLWIETILAVGAVGPEIRTPSLIRLMHLCRLMHIISFNGCLERDCVDVRNFTARTQHHLGRRTKSANNHA